MHNCVWSLLTIAQVATAEADSDSSAAHAPTSVDPTAASNRIISSCNTFYFIYSQILKQIRTMN